jgi:hypothetical protein
MGLEVTVDHPVTMGEARRLEDLLAEVDRPLLRERGLGGDDVLQGPPAEVPS